jgi:hypothetical protein
LLGCLFNDDPLENVKDMITHFLEKALINSSLDVYFANAYFLRVLERQDHLSIGCQLLRIISKAIRRIDIPDLLHGDINLALSIIQPMLSQLFSEEFFELIVSKKLPSSSFLHKAINHYDGNPNAIMTSLHALCSRMELNWEEETLIDLINYIGLSNRFVRPHIMKNLINEVLYNLLKARSSVSEELYALMDELYYQLETIVYHEALRRIQDHEHLVGLANGLTENSSPDFQLKLHAIAGHQEVPLLNLCLRLVSLNQLDDVDHVEWLYSNMQTIHCLRDQDAGNNPDELTTCNLLAQFARRVEVKLRIRLTDAQLISALLLCESHGNFKGKILEVKTGQGKSLIVLAAAFTMTQQGKKVDVITSSHDLAQRDARAYDSFM